MEQHQANHYEKLVAAIRDSEAAAVWFEFKSGTRSEAVYNSRPGANTRLTFCQEWSQNPVLNPYERDQS